MALIGPGQTTQFPFENRASAVQIASGIKAALRADTYRAQNVFAQVSR